MAVQLILKNSSVEDRRPSANQLSNGEIALNFNEAGAFLTCRDTDGSMQQVGGVKVAETAPSTPVKQTIWLKPSTNALSIYSGSSWVTIGAVTSVNGQAGAVTLTAANVGLGNVNNTSDLSKPISTATQNALDIKADLTGGKVPTSQLPSLAVSEYLGPAADQAAMLLLSGERGDWCIRTDSSSTFVLVTDGGSSIGDWQELATPASPVSSVNGFTGAVVLGASDVGAATAAQGATADSALQAGDNISDLTNDEGYITSIEAPVQSVNTQTGAAVLDAADVGAVNLTGDNMTGDLTLGTNKITLDATGGSATFASNVGIGMSSPQQKLVISEPAGSSVGARMSFINQGDRGVVAGLVGHGASPNFAISNGDQTTDFVVVGVGGNVGISDASPVNKLTVKGIGAATNPSVVTSEFTSTIKTDTAALNIGKVSTFPVIQSSGANTAYHLLLNPFAGNVGIGLTSAPPAKLSLEEDGPLGIRINRTGASATTAEIENSGNKLQFSYNGGAIQFLTGTTPIEAARFNSDGNMGLGKTNPQERLDMIGNIKINNSVIGGKLTGDVSNDSYIDVTPPISGGHFMMTVFSTYPGFAQPVGSGMVYYDTGSTRVIGVIIDTESQRSGGSVRLISGGTSTSTTAQDFTNNNITVTTPAADTIRIFNRVGGNRLFKIVFM